MFIALCRLIPPFSECDFEEHHLCGYSNQWNPNVNWYVGGSLARDPQSDLPDDHTMNNERGIVCCVTAVGCSIFLICWDASNFLHNMFEFLSFPIPTFHGDLCCDNSMQHSIICSWCFW